VTGLPRAREAREAHDIRASTSERQISGLHHHLTKDHGRAARDIRGLPLHAVHHLEHFDQSMGLLHLNHQHTSLPFAKPGEAEFSVVAQVPIGQVPIPPSVRSALTALGGAPDL
jgi:hypothetical protein